MSIFSKLIPSPIRFYIREFHAIRDRALRSEATLIHIAENWREFVIMVDDFQVPGDDGYGFDDYGGGEALTVDYIQGSVSKHDLAVFFPSARSSEETGHRRGCVVLAGKALARKVEGLKSVQRCSAWTRSSLRAFFFLRRRSGNGASQKK